MPPNGLYLLRDCSRMPLCSSSKFEGAGSSLRGSANISSLPSKPSPVDPPYS